MNLLSKLSVARKIGLGFGVLVVICLTLTLLGVLSATVSERGFTEHERVSRLRTAIEQLESDVANLQRKILAYRLARSNISVSELNDTLIELMRDVDEIKLAQVDEGSITPDTLEKIAQSVTTISESIEDLQVQRTVWLESSDKLRQSFNHVIQLVREAHSDQSMQNQEELLKLHVVLTTANIDAVRYFSEREYQLQKQTIESLDRSAIMVDGLIKQSKQLALDTPTLELLSEGVLSTQTAFYRAVQADRSFVFLVNVVIAGETSELSTLNSILTVYSEKYLAGVLARNKSELSTIKQYAVLGSTALLSLAVVIAVLIGRDIALPIKNITDTFRRLGKGEAVSSIPELSRQDEIGQLAEAASLFKQTSDKTQQLLTESIKLTKSLKLREKALKASNEELDDVTYIISHDLREPLRGLQMHSQKLSKLFKESTDDEVHRRLLRLQELTERLQKQVGDILFLARLGRTQASMESIDLYTLVLKIIDNLEAYIDEQNAQVTVRGVLPVVNCDLNKVTSIFHNLIINGIKYNQSNNKQVEIFVIQNVYLNGKHYHNVLCVADNGIGIEPTFHKEIFRFFKRLNADDVFGAGTGAGLTFVKKSVEQHGGEIWLESTLGSGSKFFFTLSEQMESSTSKV